MKIKNLYKCFRDDNYCGSRTHFVDSIRCGLVTSSDTGPEATIRVVKKFRGNGCYKGNDVPVDFCHIFTLL